MSHDRGCFCGKEPYEYEDCRRADCDRGAKARGEVMNTEFVNDRQVGGSHYRSDYQHWDWVTEHRLGYLEGCASKYVSRWWKKYGPVKGVEDIEKAKHYVQKIKDLHKTGLAVTGFSRLPDVSMAAFKTMQFGQKNGLNEAESLFCWLMASWETEASLDECLAMLDYIIKNPQKAAGGRGGGAAV